MGAHRTQNIMHAPTHTMGMRLDVEDNRAGILDDIGFVRLVTSAVLKTVAQR